MWIVRLLCTSPRGTRWWVGTKCNKTMKLLIWLTATTTTPKRSRNETDTETDTDSENEQFLRGNNRPRFLIMKGTDDNLPLSKRSPCAVQKGFQAIAGTLKSTKRLRDGCFLVECLKRTQAEILLKTVKLLIGMYSFLSPRH